MIPRTRDRIRSQDAVRQIMSAVFGTYNDVYVKYVYDGYTYEGGYHPIRKPKTRKKVAREFHELGYDKARAKSIVSYIIRMEW